MTNAELKDKLTQSIFRIEANLDIILKQEPASRNDEEARRQLQNNLETLKQWAAAIVVVEG